VAVINVKCIHCQSNQVIKYGKTQNEKQRYRCCASSCSHTFLLDYSYKGCLPHKKQDIVTMALNASGIRDTARVLGVSLQTILTTIKKKASSLIKVNWNLLNRTCPDNREVLVLPIETELDEQWSFVQNKENRRWLWVALHHRTSEILAFTFGSRKDEVCKKLKKLLEPFNISRYFTDGLPAYQRLLPSDQHEAGKRNTQKIERKFLTLRTRIKRLARKTICFSKKEIMHDTVIGLFINRFEFSRNV
jgi:insertion element IS1 protein InsB